MRRLLLITLSPLLSLAAAPEGERWWSHIEFLASDKRMGRDTGSKGHKEAVAYLSARFKEIGLTPCGTKGFLQPVALVRRRIDEDKSSLEIVRNGAAEPLALGSTAMFSLRLMSASPRPLDAPAVFAGYALTAKELSYDDFEGLDVKGKIAVFVSGSPASLPGPVRAHFSSTAERAKALRAAGAVGSISITNPRSADIPWERSVRSRLAPAMSLDDPTQEDGRGLDLSASVNPAEADKLFAGSGHTVHDLFAAMDRGERLPRFTLPLSIRARATIRVDRLVSDNVCGKLVGTGPESIALTAHIDHIGVGAAVNGDRIFNGAMDNASGIATMIEVARALKTRGAPGRSVLFVAVTAEEKGLLGSRHFAAHPTVPIEKMTANINFDMFLPIHPMKHLMVLGLEESTLRGPLEKVARDAGVAVQADPEPQRNRFIRSDQYSFILRGVPAVALKVGYAPGSPEDKLQKEWTEKRYHAVGDDLAQPVDRDAAVLFNRIVENLAWIVAGADERPAWNEASFFRRFGVAAAATARP